MIRALLTFSLMSFWMACTNPKPAAQAAAENPAQCGSTITAKAGDTFTLSLEGNPSTGYSWYQTEESKTVAAQQGESSFKSSNSDPMVVGAGVTMAMTFKVLKSGTFTTEYRRIWEKGIPAVRDCKITVQAQ